MDYLRKDVERPDLDPLVHSLFAVILFPIFDHSVVYHLRAGSVINEGPTDSLCPLPFIPQGCYSQIETELRGTVLLFL